jgi:hypothetical protein
MRQLRTLIVSLSVVLLSACVVVPYPRQGGYYGSVASGSGAMANAPAPYVEVVPAIPFPGALWIGGYWGWGGGQRQWVPGRWEQPHHGHSGHQ